jgi:hypothetical protein
MSMLFATFPSLSSLICMLCATFVLLVDGHLFIDVLVSDLIFVLFVSHLNAIICNICASCRRPLADRRIVFWAHFGAQTTYVDGTTHLCAL